MPLSYFCRNSCFYCWNFCIKLWKRLTRISPSDLGEWDHIVKSAIVRGDKVQTFLGGRTSWLVNVLYLGRKARLSCSVTFTCENVDLRKFAKLKGRIVLQCTIPFVVMLYECSPSESALQLTTCACIMPTLQGCINPLGLS